MKKLYFYLVSMLVAAVVAVGCTEDITKDEVYDGPIGEVVKEMMTVTASLECDEPAEGEESRTTLTDNNGGKIVWSEGDAIGAISADGTITECAVTAIDGSNATFSVPADTKYAIYPYASGSTFDTEKNTLDYTMPHTRTVDGSKKVFGNKENVMCAHLVNKNLSFKNLCGYIEVKLKGTGTVKHVALRNNSGKWDALSGLGTINFSDANEPKVTTGTDHGSTFNFAYATCSNVELSTAEATSFYFIVPPRTYENMAICVQTDKGSYAIQSKNAITVNRSMIRPISAINIDNLKPATATNLAEGGVANCYVVPQGGEAKYYSFPARKINGTANLENVAYAHISWSESPTLVTNVCYDAASGKVSFKYEGNNAEGNAHIALLDASHNILWSYHIWCTDQPQKLIITTANMNHAILDRNLGATYTPKTVTEAKNISANEAVESMGLYYQYGRYSPFPRAASATTRADSKAFVGNTRVAVQYAFARYNQFLSCSNAVYAYNNALKYPKMFYYIGYSSAAASESTYNKTGSNAIWYGKSVYNPFTYSDKLWHSENAHVVSKKSDNDPCPAGYCVEDQVSAEAYLVGNALTAATGKFGAYREDATTKALIWLPYQGFRTYNTALVNYIGYNGTSIGNYNLWAAYTEAPANNLNCVRISGTTSPSLDAAYTQASMGAGIRCRAIDRSDLQGITPVSGFEGQGTEASPYLIKSADDLVKLSNLCNGSAVASGPTDFKSAHYAMTTTINMSGKTFKPINNFSGVFDGKTYTISNLVVTPVSGQPNGMFGTIENATVKNLTLEQSSLNVTTNDLCAGGFAGKATNSTFDNCTFNGIVMSACSASFVSVSGTNGASAVVGGIVAYAINTNITNCNISGQVRASKGQFVGGMAGHIEGGKIDKCNAVRSAYIYAKSNHAGGIVARMTKDAEVTNCTVDTPVYCSYAINGGIVGRMQSGLVSNCLVTSNSEIVGHQDETGTSYVGTGGIVGTVQTANNQGTSAVVTNCACYANVIANVYIGGIVGEVSPTVAGTTIEINNCLFQGSLETRSSTYNATNKTYDWGVSGGVVGCIGNGTPSGTASVSHCTALVNGIRFNTKAQYAGYGGVAGYVKKSTFNNCYSNLNVANIKDQNGTKITLANHGSLYGVGWWGANYGNPSFSNCYYLSGSKIGRDSGTPALTNVAALTDADMTNGTLLNKLKSVGGLWVANAEGYPVPSGVPANTGTTSTPAKTRVSVIGDSISTFEGWMPSGYVKYYPNKTVTNASQTYWYKLIYNKMSNATLEKNIAWSGTVVARSTDADYLASDHGAGHCFVERFRDDGMGNPDVILLHGGTNDCSNRGKSIALYPGYPTYGGSGYDKTACPTKDVIQSKCASAAALTTRDQILALNDTTFVEAYIKLLCLMHQKYPQAKVVMIIGDKIHAGTRLAIQYIANYYASTWGYRCVNLQDAECGTISKLPDDSTHPDEAGFETMANYIYTKVGSYID